jgi:hypothetical protein
MNETINNGDPSAHTKGAPPQEQKLTLPRAKGEDQQDEAEQLSPDRSIPEWQPPQIPPEIEHLIDIVKRFVIFVRDHESFNAIVIVLTLVIAAATISQGITSYLQWRTMRDANRLTDRTLELNKKMFDASQAATFNCGDPALQQIGTDHPWIIEICLNNGKIAAHNVTVEFELIRSGQREERQKRTIQREFVPENGPVSTIFQIVPPFTSSDFAKNAITMRASVVYDSGIENHVQQSYCWVFWSIKGQYNWMVCENADAVKPYIAK